MARASCTDAFAATCKTNTYQGASGSTEDDISIRDVLLQCHFQECLLPKPHNNEQIFIFVILEPQKNELFLLQKKLSLFFDILYRLSIMPSQYPDENYRWEINRLSFVTFEDKNRWIELSKTVESSLNQITKKRMKPGISKYPHSLLSLRTRIVVTVVTHNCGGKIVVTHNFAYLWLLKGIGD